MKTFDEAFEIIEQQAAKKDAIFLENHSAGIDYMQNERFCGTIEGLGLNLLLNLALLQKDEDKLLYLCAMLHQIFSFGVQVGIIMEREELK